MFRGHSFDVRRNRVTFTGMGEANSSAALIAEGLDPGIANNNYSTSWYADYNFFRSKGVLPLNAWQYTEVASLDQEAIKIALNKGTPPELVAQARNYGVLMDKEDGRNELEYIAGQSIRYGNDPVEALSNSIRARGGVPVVGATPAPPVAPPPPAPPPPAPPSPPPPPAPPPPAPPPPAPPSPPAPPAPPVCTGTVEQCTVAASNPYWLFPSGHTGALQPNIDITVNPLVSDNLKTYAPWAIGAGIVLLLAGKKGVFK